MRLGGWWRLWLALAAVYAAVVALVVAATWPNIESVEHHPSFLYRMSESAQAVLNRAGLPTRQELEQALIEADRRGAVEDARRLARAISDRRQKPAWSEAPILLEMPNKHRLEVVAQTPKSEMELLSGEYTRILRTELQAQRYSAVAGAFLYWLIPMAVIGVLGMLARWVYDGFRRQHQ